MTSQGCPLLVLVGTKAQFIKTAPILLEMDRRQVAFRLVYTGQHSETFDALEAAFGTRPADDHLVPGTEADSVGGLFGWMFRFWRAVGKRLRSGEWKGAPWGLVHGDTASTLLSALALRLAGVPVAHIEAGLRSPTLFSPFPEEIVRRLVSRLATLHLAPDASAAANLRGVCGIVVNTGGNTLRDSLRLALRGMVSRSETETETETETGGGGGYAIVSLHRSENLGSKAAFTFLMEEVLHASRLLPVRFVLHPVTRRKLIRTGWMPRLAAEPGVTMLERTDYASFVRLMLGARFLMTDGGSNQEEAAMLGLPTLLMRKETERPDGLDGSVVLSRLDRSRVREFVRAHADTTWRRNPLHDDGFPSKELVDALTAGPVAGRTGDSDGGAGR